MKKLLTFTISALLAVFFTTSAVSAQTPKPVKKAKPKAALLYKVTGNGLAKPSYIFGTIHIVCPDDMFPMEQINTAIAGSDRLILELDMDDPKELAVMGGGVMIAGGKSFTEYLTPDEYKKVDEWVTASLGISVDKVKTLKPIMLQTMLLTQPKIIGCAKPGAYETTFMGTATANKKDVEGLETAAFQFEALDKIPLEKQAKDLYKAAQNPQLAADQFKSLVAAYKLQDSNKLYDELNRQMADSRAMQVTLLDERNAIWVPKLEAAMKEKPSFIAVGGGHLGGKKGILNLLKKQGYKLEPIKL
jgi:uncharacterized protein YbaP (TraB family)